ncbi:WW domain-binding protein 4 [Fopius arisanus]|uniref:WW domain-binding protein 4 n=1 Tax=Fopius arisanus TaxID=64838 RepID=A0A9R1T0C9_9HYME|nr:PREDICTED: WW domain-binding protein 4 [Fopius arisanus]
MLRQRNIAPQILWADYWKSQGRKFCDFCKCWIADNKPSIQFHEGGKKHKENVTKRLKEIHKNSAKQAKQTRKFENDLKNMENAAMAAYLKDVEGNMADLTAQQIIRDKRDRTEALAVEDNPNQMPAASPDTNPRHKRPQGLPADIDYCDPTTFHRARAQARTSNPSSSGNSSENKTQGKTKTSREKRKGKRESEGDKSNRHLVPKLWYEAHSPEGFTYYWHTETNETTWEPPEEGFMTIGEQEEEAREQALQEELLGQLKEEETKARAEVIEEQRANAERERLKELRKQPRKSEDEGTEGPTEEIPYRRDYSVPDKVDPYGPWQTVEVLPKKKIDLQLPQKREVFQVPKPQEPEPFLPQRTFKEKIVTQVRTGDSDDESSGVSFKKRKFGNRSVRKRLDDD